MKQHLDFRPGVLLAVGIGVGLFLSGAPGLVLEPLVLQGHAQQIMPPKPSAAVTAQLDLQTLSERSPDQSHAMADVGYHFANLWFAADKQNWPLANYYLGETRSHLRWAVRLHPVRQTKAGEVDLKGILDAVDNSFLIEICYACHKACEKPFLRPQVPNAASMSILNFDPNASWPE